MDTARAGPGAPHRLVAGGRRPRAGCRCWFRTLPYGVGCGPKPERPASRASGRGPRRDSPGYLLMLGWPLGSRIRAGARAPQVGWLAAAVDRGQDAAVADEIEGPGVDRGHDGGEGAPEGDALRQRNRAGNE